MKPSQALMLLFLTPGLAFAQALAAPSKSSEPASTARESTSQAGEKAAASSAEAEGKKDFGLPKGFRSIELGMSIDEVEGLLKKDGLFDYRGPSDVSLLPSPNMSLIEVEGLSFVKRGFFQFYEGKLWVMAFFLNPDKIDHYSIYSSLTAKYGEPGLIDPKEARWEDASMRLALERPLTLRYMDMGVFNRLNEGSEAREGLRELERQNFLEGL
jgi:hypothetical protein